MRALELTYCLEMVSKPQSKELSAISIQLLAFLIHFLSTVLYSLASIFFTSINSIKIFLEFSTDKYSKSVDKIIWYSSSVAEPRAIFKKYPNCGSLPLPQPSAMLVGTDDAERRIWLTKPYISSLGNGFVSLYTFNATLCDFSQTFRSLKSFITKNYLLVKASGYQLNAERSTQVRPSQTNSLQHFLNKHRKQ